MKKIGTVLASAALALGLLFFGSYVGPAGSMRKAKALTGPVQPNVVFILADDMRKDDLKYMPKTEALLQNAGMTFENTFVSNALCCPSRVHHHARPVLPQHRRLVQLLNRQPFHHHRRLASLPGQWKRERQRGHAPARRWLQDRAFRQIPERLHGHHLHPPGMG